MPEDKEDPKKKGGEDPKNKKVERKTVVKEITPPPMKSDTFDRFRQGIEQQRKPIKEIKFTAYGEDKSKKKETTIGVIEEETCSLNCICNSDVSVDSNGFIIHDKINKNKIESCNKGGKLAKVKIIVLHRTSGGAASGTLNHMKNSGYGAHFVIDNQRGVDGVIHHTISLNKKGSHMGAAQFASTKKEGWGNHNSIGIEVCGYSFTKDGEKRVGNKEKIPHDHWEEITETQAKSVVCLVKFLIKYFDLTIEDVKCHEDLCSKDPDEGKFVYKNMMKYW